MHNAARGPLVNFIVMLMIFSKIQTPKLDELDFQFILYWSGMFGIVIV